MSAPSPVRRSTPRSLAVLAAITALEALGMLALAVWLVVLTVAQPPSGAALTSAVALAVLAAVGALLLVALAVGTLRARTWTRAAGIVWQLVQLLVGLYAFQPPGARPDLGLVAIVPAVVALVLLFGRPVRTALMRA